MALRISIRPMSSHTYNGKRHVGEPLDLCRASSLAHLAYDTLAFQLPLEELANGSQGLMVLNIGR